MSGIQGALQLITHHLPGPIQQLGIIVLGEVSGENGRCMLSFLQWEDYIV